jgi:hypothetical protein
MTLHSNGLFRFWLRQAVSTIIGWPASPSLPETKMLVFGATIHFVRHSKYLQVMKMNGRFVEILAISTNIMR